MNINSQIQSDINSKKPNSFFYSYPDTNSVVEHSQGPVKVYFQSSFEIKYNENTKSYGMFSTEFIPAKTLILIDCGLHGSQEYIESVVSNDSVYKPLLNDLYPRDKDIPSKLIYNCFGNKEKSSLYFTISKINHNCTPNALYSYFNWTQDIIKAGYVIGSIVSINNIQKGEEITIQYSLQAGHGCKVHDWICDCNKSEQERKSYVYEREINSFMTAKMKNLKLFDTIIESVKKDINKLNEKYFLM
jgi:hypothetical protein